MTACFFEGVLPGSSPVKQHESRRMTWTCYWSFIVARGYQLHHSSWPLARGMLQMSLKPLPISVPFAGRPKRAHMHCAGQEGTHMHSVGQEGPHPARQCRVHPLPAEAHWSLCARRAWAPEHARVLSCAQVVGSTAYGVDFNAIEPTPNGASRSEPKRSQLALTVSTHSKRSQLALICTAQALTVSVHLQPHLCVAREEMVQACIWLAWHCVCRPRHHEAFALELSICQGAFFSCWQFLMMLGMNGGAMRQGLQPFDWLSSSSEYTAVAMLTLDCWKQSNTQCKCHYSCWTIKIRLVY